ncbi:MAG: LLM class flavin-dependent oxidoreductase [Actinomycetota bacterium]|nr:LLM class flavin-dependent oxidoreductase [Actinomycetota bacterium]
MRVGITLPQFRPTVAASLAAARTAESSGLDGVFVFDHVWSIGNPDRPARSAWPLLGALAGETDRLYLGPLVARVSLLPNAVLAHNLETLHRMVGERLLAGLGAGDHLSEAENVAVGVPFPPATERLAALADACSRVRDLGITVWVGGLSEKVHRLAVAGADALNLWGVEPERVAAVHDIEVTWGGPAPKDAVAAADLLDRLRSAGATWAVLGPPYGADDDPTAAVEMVAGAAATLR